MKRCMKCGEEKEFGEFSKSKNGKYGLYSQCKACVRRYKKENKDKIKDYNKEYYEKNKDKLKKHKKEYYKKYYEKNREKLIIYSKKTYQKNKERKKEYDKIYRIKNKQRIKEYNNIPKQKLHGQIRTGINKSLRNGKQRKSWKNIVSFTFDELKNHLESRFKKNMTWNNIGEWHIDHIIPVSKFDFEFPEDKEFKMCWSLNNLQPMWALENNNKRNKLDYYTDEEYKNLGVWDILCCVREKYKEI